ncbi:MAG: biopolymer transporter ExbD [Planctomycetia bacterium]|nr:biopolymer transporter ExbD [Planctomycetia bacterium]
MARRRRSGDGPESDMTPMIDMVFQLLIFFMILINFADADQNARVKLPENDIVKPPEQPVPDAVTLQIAAQEKKRNEYSVLIGAEEFLGEKDLKRLKAALDKEVKFVKTEKKKTAKDMTIILRVHKDTPIGFVNKVIHTCQEADLENFALRATAKVK